MTTESQGKEERHVARMQRKKEIVDQKVAAADQERGAPCDPQRPKPCQR